MSRCYHLEVYGCQMNAADGELIEGILQADGWVPVGDPAAADLIVINTCAVRERAVQRVVGHVQSLRPLKASRPGLRIALVGCLAAYQGRELSEQLPEVDFFVGPDGYRRLPELLSRRPPASRAPVIGDRGETYADLPSVRRMGIHAWISIMRGCNRMCAYCVVPFARGRERSLPAPMVIETARDAVARGHVALTLLGQTVTSYRDGAIDFADLLEALCGLPGLIRIRFLAAHPGDFQTRLLKTIAAHGQIARHLHLPVQSGSDRILAAMRRGYTRDDYLTLVGEAHRLIPGLAVTTDLIAGFPGEDDQDFAHTLELMQRVEFDGAFMFAYSPRPGTYAARRLADDVPAEVKQERLRRMITLQERHSLGRYESRIGRPVEVLVEGPARSPAGHGYGRTDDFKDVIFAIPDGSLPASGRLVTVDVTEATSHTLLGSLRVAR
ncbi:MAG: tRNA (N6-isopentenyl adenosine(37)-C2)-methylthiotransferase MiaB [Candidatus Eisenbacteria bacterium]